MECRWRRSQVSQIAATVNSRSRTSTGPSTLASSCFPCQHFLPFPTAAISNIHIPLKLLVLLSLVSILPPPLQAKQKASDQTSFNFLPPNLPIQLHLNPSFPLVIMQRDSPLSSRPISLMFLNPMFYTFSRTLCFKLIPLFCIINSPSL